MNKISSLADFEDCQKLQELYLRKNNIKDINDLVYLQVKKNEFIFLKKLEFFSDFILLVNWI